MFYDRSFSINFLSYIQNWFFGKHWPLTNNQKHFIVYNNMHVYIIKTNYPLFVQWVIDICPNPSFFAILINKDLGIVLHTRRVNKYFGNGLVLLDDVQIEPEMVDTNVLYSVLRGKMTSSKNNWIGQH